MIESKHTPGPWIVDTDYIIQAGGTSNENTIAIVGDQEEWKANAHLIASAPDLLEALENECRLCRHGNGNSFNPDCPNGKMCLIHRVINKAKGIQQ